MHVVRTLYFTYVKSVFLNGYILEEVYVALDIYFFFTYDKLFWIFTFMFATKMKPKIFVLSLFYRIGDFEILTNLIDKCI